MFSRKDKAMDDVKSQKKKYGCAKCGADCGYGPDKLYAIAGDYAVKLCDDCREHFAANAPTWPWFQAWERALFRYHAAELKFTGRMDISQDEIAASLMDEWAVRREASIEARKHLRTWLDADVDVSEGAA